MLAAKDIMVFYENMLALNNVSITCEQNQIDCPWNRKYPREHQTY